MAPRLRNFKLEISPPQSASNAPFPHYWLWKDWQIARKIRWNRAKNSAKTTEI
jgi:hypothetical protein